MIYVCLGVGWLLQTLLFLFNSILYSIVNTEMALSY